MNPAPGAESDRVIVAEPPARYRMQLPVVVDSSLICAVLFDEACRDEALRQLSDRRLLGPDLLDHEVVNVALTKRRQGWPVASVEQALADFADYRIELMACDQRAQFDLAERYALSACDAAYLWVAAECRAPLLTFDRRLGDAARRHLGALE